MENMNLKFDHVFILVGKGAKEMELFEKYAFIHPEGKYFLTEYYDTTEDGNVDIGICFKLDDNSFSKPINLGGRINKKYVETCATLSPDLK
jgi:hypothetical protein